MLICVSAAGATECYGKDTTSPQVFTCKIVNCDVAERNIDDFDHIHNILMTLTYKYLMLITYCRYAQKLARTILASHETNTQTGKRFLVPSQNSPIK